MITELLSYSWGLKVLLLTFFFFFSLLNENLAGYEDKEPALVFY